MILAKELNPHDYKTNPNIDNNLKILFERLIELQDAYGHDLIITSGLRSDEQQLELRQAGKTNAIHSKHLAGAAADVLDEDGELAKWTKDNLQLMEKIGFWMEDFAYTHGWVHYQIMAPFSGKRVFIP